MATKTSDDLVKENIDSDIRVLDGYKSWYVMQAALAKDCGYDKIADAYLQAVLQLEMCIQGIGTIPSMVKRV